MHRMLQSHQEDVQVKFPSQIDFRAISQLLKLRFTAMVTYSFHLRFPQLTSFHSVFHSFHGLMNSINWPAYSIWVFIAQLLEHCSATQRSRVLIPLKPRKFFFSGYFAIAYIYVISYKSFALHGIFPSPFHLNNVNLFMTNDHLIYSCDNLCSANGKLAKSNSGCNFV